MTAKQYLSQAKRLDMRINTKLEQIQTLTDLATNCTSVINDMPRHSSDVVSRTEDSIINLMSLQDEVKSEVNELVNMKRDIMCVVKQVADVEQQILLEKRYLCFSAWELISVDMGYSIQYTYRIHERALKEISKILKEESKVD